MTKELSVKISDELYTRFMRVVSLKGGLWRGTKQKPDKAVNSAVESALSSFLDRLEKGPEEGNKQE
jgi:hypothetical protein